MSIHTKIAADVWPDGLWLRCANPECDRGEKITTADAAYYLGHGWPKHCGRTMRTNDAPPKEAK